MHVCRRRHRRRRRQTLHRHGVRTTNKQTLTRGRDDKRYAMAVCNSARTRCKSMLLVLAFLIICPKSDAFQQISPSSRVRGVDQNAEDALERLVAAVGADGFQPIKNKLNKSPKGVDELTPRTVAMSFAHYLPTHAIVVDEGATAGGGCYPSSAQSEPHDWLTLTGGSIGFGLPTAIGAAVACPDRKVVCVQGDGGAMYTIQSLWTMARENLDICVIILANRKYQILQIELARVGAQSMTKKTLDMLDIGNPDLDFVQLSQGMGVKASRVTTIDDFNAVYGAAMRTFGPQLIEVVLP